MKISTAALIALAFAIGGCNQESTPEKNTPQKTELSNSLEYKVASIDAGKNIPENDLTIGRARNLLDAAEPVYSLPKGRIADIAAKSQEIAKDRGLSVKISDLLDWSLIACDTKCTETQLSEYLSAYIITRTTAGQTHHQAIHGLVILNNLNRRLENK